MTDQQTFSEFTQGRSRVVIEHISPEVDGGRHPIKRVPGEPVVVEADIFADGHDTLSAVLKFRRDLNRQWSEVPMKPLVNDRWRGTFAPAEIGDCFYTIEAWVDHFQSWRNDLKKRVQAGQEVSVELLIGAGLIEAAATRAPETEARRLRAWAVEISRGEPASLSWRTERALDEKMAAMTSRFPDRRLAGHAAREWRVVVDPVLARAGAWYEMFPRSCPGRKGRHGTFQDVEAHLPRIAEMGFDVLYFPPVHPVGRAFRKGKNNNPDCAAGRTGQSVGHRLG